MAGRIRTGLSDDSLSDISLRKFAWILAALILVFGGVLVPWRWGAYIREVSVGIAAVLALWGAIAPASLKPLYVGWLSLGHALGWVNSRIILAILFFGIVTPTAIGLRLFGRDSMKRTTNTAMQSYRTVRGAPISREDLERPY